jgi:NADH-quinone oxidoreductase subunit J
MTPLPAPLPALGAAAWLAEVVFLLFAAVAVLGGLLAALTPRIVLAAFGLLGALLGVAGLYALLGADFVALAHVLVYVGGILVLLAFGVLLTERLLGPLGLDRRPSLLLPVVSATVLLVLLLVAVHATSWPQRVPPGEPAPTTKDLGRALLDPSGYLVPFELVSVLLLAALVGAAWLARRRREP